MNKIKTVVEHEGQKYLDEPVYLLPKRISIMERSVANAFNRRTARPLLTEYNRVTLRWMQPDGALNPDGTQHLVPKKRRERQERVRSK